MDRRRNELDSLMVLVMCVMLKGESDSAPDVLVRIGLVPSRGERRTLSHVWAHLLRQVKRELVLRPSDLAPLSAYSSRMKASAAGQGGRPRANRAEDWNRRPPAEVVATRGLFQEEELAAAAEPRAPLRRLDRQLMGCCIRRYSGRYCADDVMSVSDRLRMDEIREPCLLSMRGVISYCYEFDESLVVAGGFGFRDVDPEVEETEDLVHRDLEVPPGRLVLETHELV